MGWCRDRLGKKLASADPLKHTQVGEGGQEQWKYHAPRNTERRSPPWRASRRVGVE
jgi:hypothetical protein